MNYKQLTEDLRNRVIQGHVLDVLQPLPDNTFQCVVTSPPFFGLRFYGTPPQVWQNGQPVCEDGRHEWGEEQPKPIVLQVGNPEFQRKWREQAEIVSSTRTSGVFCQRCGAWRGELGSEPSPEEFISHLVDVFREVRRVLRKDGVVWVNMGDSYWGSGNASGHTKETENFQRTTESYGATKGHTQQEHASLKPKDLCLIPERLAIALQKDGWWVRSKPPWVKGNPLPESVKDRPSTSTETWLMFTKSKHYYYDAEAVRQTIKTTSEQAKSKWKSRRNGTGKGQQEKIYHEYKTVVPFQNDPNPAGRNRRTSDFFYESLDALIEQHEQYLAYLYAIRDKGGMLMDEEGEPLALCFNTKPFSGAHFAVFPPTLIKPMIQSSTSEKGCCAKCGAPWVRIVEKGFTDHTGKTQSAYKEGSKAKSLALLRQAAREQGQEYVNTSKTLGWQPSCDCQADVVSCLCLDPFAGTGSTGEAVYDLGRDYTLIELKQEYVEEIAKPCLKRVMQQQRLF